MEGLRSSLSTEFVAVGDADLMTMWSWASSEIMGSSNAIYRSVGKSILPLAAIVFVILMIDEDTLDTIKELHLYQKCDNIFLNGTKSSAQMCTLILAKRER